MWLCAISSLFCFQGFLRKLSTRQDRNLPSFLLNTRPYKWEPLMTLELTRVGLLVLLANQYTTQGDLDQARYVFSIKTKTKVNRYKNSVSCGGERIKNLTSDHFFKVYSSNNNCQIRRQTPITVMADMGVVVYKSITFFSFEFVYTIPRYFFFFFSK